MTERLYNDDSYLEEFDCKVISLYNEDGELYIETDRTAFFPEGGGQLSDVGYLGELYVKDVQNKCGKLFHIVENFEENVEKIQIGMNLHGKIDMKRRFSFMQQHSGEHIFSGIVHSLYGFDNVGFHLGLETVSLDFNGVLEYEDVCKVESLVNEAVWKNLEIKAFYPSEEEIQTIDYRSKKEIDEELRLVEIPGVDICACCAPHVKRTGEIGMIEVVSFEKYKGGTRLFILCGNRALADIRKKLDQNKQVSNLLSAKETETFAMVQKVKNDCARLNFELTGAKMEALKLKAQQIEADEKIVVFCSISDTASLREYADILSHKAESFVAAFGGEGEDYKYVIITQSDYDISSLCKRLNAAFSGRGGGRGNIVQGSLRGSEESIKAFFSEV